MKDYEEIARLEYDISRAERQLAFLEHQLTALDDSIEKKKRKLDDDISEYNIRSKKDQEIINLHITNIKKWSEKLEKAYSNQLKSLRKEKKVQKIIEKTPAEREREELEYKLEQLKAQEKRKRSVYIQPEVPYIKKTPADELGKIEAVQEQVGLMKKDINGQVKAAEVSLKIWLENTPEGQALQEQFHDEEGGYAIWRNNITKTFRIWCKDNNHTLGG